MEVYYDLFQCWVRYLVGFILLTLIWVGFLGVSFEFGGWVKLPRLKPAKIMLETSNLACKYTPMCSFRK